MLWRVLRAGLCFSRAHAANRLDRVSVGGGGSIHRMTAALRVLQDGGTALMRAASKGHTATATELVRLGADIHAKGKVRAC